MKGVVYYLTMSLDGFIATKDGSVSWLTGAPNVDYGYEEFYHSIDTILMGSKTYEKICAISDQFPYPDKNVTVFSSRELPCAGDNIDITDKAPEEVVARLKLTCAGPLWLCGGGKLAATLLDKRLIDEIRIFIQPIVLGKGIPLFSQLQKATTFEIDKVVEWPMLTELRYRVVKPWRSDV